MKLNTMKKVVVSTGRDPSSMHMVDNRVKLTHSDINDNYKVELNKIFPHSWTNNVVYRFPDYKSSFINKNICDFSETM